MPTDIECEQIDHVLLVRLNRPEAKNAITSAMYSELTAALRRAEADPDIRAVVLTGAGAAFCVGADINDLAAEESRALTQGPVRTPLMTSVPVIAAINGACAGVGLMLAVQSDVRFVSESARLATSFSRLGMVAEQEMAWLLTAIVGRGRASDLLLSGRTITAADALDYGLAEFAIPAEAVLSSALAYAADLAANCSPRATVAIKQQLATAPASSWWASRGVGQRLALEAFDWPDFAEGVASWLGRRTPNFPGHSTSTEADHDGGAMTTPPTAASPYRVAELTGLIGTELEPGTWFAIDQDRVDRFADATDDHQWIHQDSEAARQGAYGGPIAHGFLIQSLFAGHWQQILPIRDATTMINYGTNRVRFLTPVTVGSALRLRLKVDDVVPHATGADLHLTATFELRDADRPACVMQQITRIIGSSSTTPDGSERN